MGFTTIATEQCVCRTSERVVWWENSGYFKFGPSVVDRTLKPSC